MLMMLLVLLKLCLLLHSDTVVNAVYGVKDVIVVGVAKAVDVVNVVVIVNVANVVNVVDAVMLFMWLLLLSL